MERLENDSAPKLANNLYSGPFMIHE